MLYAFFRTFTGDSKFQELLFLRKQCITLMDQLVDEAGREEVVEEVCNGLYILKNIYFSHHVMNMMKLLRRLIVVEAI